MTQDETSRSSSSPRSIVLAGATFVAIDFETADHGPDSACSVGLVRVEGGRIAATAHRLIRPPRKHFFFTYIHGIGWDEVKEESAFRRVWLDLRGMLDGAQFLAAHFAPFDRNVLLACCEEAGLTHPALPFLCTVRLARKVWSARPANLPSVCQLLGISLKHHDAASDAEACARIVLAAQTQAPELALSLPRSQREGMPSLRPKPSLRPTPSPESTSFRAAQPSRRARPSGRPTSFRGAPS